MVLSGPLTPQRSRRRLKIANLASLSTTTFSGHDDNFKPTVGSFPAESRANICPQKRQSVPLPLPIIYEWIPCPRGGEMLAQSWWKISFSSSPPPIFFLFFHRTATASATTKNSLTFPAPSDSNSSRLVTFFLLFLVANKVAICMQNIGFACKNQPIHMVARSGQWPFEDGLDPFQPSMW